jgi:hypothetical protein
MNPTKLEIRGAVYTSLSSAALRIMLKQETLQTVLKF